MCAICLCLTFRVSVYLARSKVNLIRKRQGNNRNCTSFVRSLCRRNLKWLCVQQFLLDSVVESRSRAIPLDKLR